MRPSEQLQPISLPISYSRFRREKQKKFLQPASHQVPKDRIGELSSVSFNLLHLEPRSGLSSGGGATVAPSRAGLTPFPPADPRALSPCSMRGNKKRPDLRGRPAGRVLRMHGDRGGVGAGDSGRRAGSAPAACAPRRREGGRGWLPAVAVLLVRCSA